VTSKFSPPEACFHEVEQGEGEALEGRCEGKRVGEKRQRISF